MQPQTDLGSLKTSTNLFFGSVFLEPHKERNNAEEDQKKVEEDILWYAGLSKNGFHAITNRRLLDSVIREEKKGVLIHIEGAGPLTPKAEHILEHWHAIGLRSIGFLWNNDNALGTAASSNHSSRGLTTFGKQMVRRCNELGILLDCAHINQAGFYDILKLSKYPPLITHGNAYRLCQNPRNFTDRQIKDLVAAGGIMGVFFSAKYVRLDRPVTAEDVIDHIVHIASLVGTGAIAIGSDFGGITSGLIPHLAHLTDMPDFRKKLEKRGFSKNDIANIFGLNALRYVRSVIT